MSEAVLGGTTSAELFVHDDPGAGQAHDRTGFHHCLPRNGSQRQQRAHPEGLYDVFTRVGQSGPYSAAARGSIPGATASNPPIGKDLPRGAAIGCDRHCLCRSAEARLLPTVGQPHPSEVRHQKRPITAQPVAPTDFPRGRTRRTRGTTKNTEWEKYAFPSRP